MEQDELLEYAELATAMKDDIASEALVLEEHYKMRKPEGAVTDRRIDSLVQKRFHPQSVSKLAGLPKKNRDHIGIDQVRARRTIHELTPQEIDKIVHCVKVDFRSYKDAAAIHCVKPSLVQTIMSKLKKDPEFTKKRGEKLQSKLDEKEMVAQLALSKLRKNEKIMSSQSLADELNTSKGTELKAHQVQKVLRHGLGLKYKCFSGGEVQANSQRCLVERQQFAKVLFRLIQQGKRIYNVDETWLDQMTFTRRHWRPVRMATEGVKPVSPRISLIACVGSDGSSFYSLTQVNTDHNVFCLYLTELAKKLSAHDKNFRENSVLLLE
jgi:hypothetical protein